MRQCILKLLWPKEDIVNFFASNSCTKADIKVLGDYKVMPRAGIVDTMFTHLATKSDSGLGQFRAMLQSLIAWTHFDDYYFVMLAKLSRSEAENAITPCNPYSQQLDGVDSRSPAFKLLAEFTSSRIADSAICIQPHFTG